MIKNLYAAHHFLGLMLSGTLRIFTASGSFHKDSLDKSSLDLKCFPECGYAAVNRTAAYHLTPVTIHNPISKVML
ncbi:hypothetical protein [Dyadobacter sediminis]|uniref:hypothetical protein n=1 Tax=Dyadobacter sediminis TaxID=1493691 RepID=UPI0011075AF1|nr:hypothetical protein [Dyadobacter sediminis]